MQAQITSPVARLSEFGGDRHVVHGVALGEDDTTRGTYGLKRWPRESLEPAAASLTHSPVMDTHGGAKVGRVTRSAYEPGVGVVYEAVLEDSDLANQLSLGQREVSIEAQNPERVEHDDEGAAILHGFEFSGMAIVTNGASPSNHSSPGAAADNPAVAALSADDIAASLANYEVEYSRTAGGKLDEPNIPSEGFESRYLIDGATKSASSFPVVDAQQRLRRGNVASAWDRRGHAPDESAMREALLDLNEAFDDPPIETDEQAEAAASAGDESPEGEGPSLTDERNADNDSSETMTDDNTGEETYKQLAAKLAESGDTIEEQRAEIEALEAEKAELEAEKADLVEEIEELEDDNEEIETVKAVYAAELADGERFDEDELAEKFSVTELREKFEADEEADLVDDGPEPDVQTGGGDEEAALSLDDSEREEAQDIKRRIEYWDGKNDTIVEAEKVELAELAGADSADDVMEAI